MPRRSAEARKGALGALVAGLTPVGGGDEGQVQATQEVPLDRLRPSPLQARRTFDEGSLADLAASIRKQGVLQPLLVRPAESDPGGYEVIAGERRWRASRMAGLTQVPVVIRPLTDDEAYVAGAAENLQREDLNIIDEVDLTIGLVARTLGIEVTEAAARLHVLANRPHEDPEAVEKLEVLFTGLGRGIWNSFVKNKLRVLRWPPEVLQAMREQGLGYSVAGVVVAAPPEHRAALLRLATAGASKAELRKQLLSFRKDKPADRLRRVSRALQDRRRLDGLGAQDRKRVDRLVVQLEQLLGVDAEQSGSQSS